MWFSIGHLYCTSTETRSNIFGHILIFKSLIACSEKVPSLNPDLIESLWFNFCPVLHFFSPQHACWGWLETLNDPLVWTWENYVCVLWTGDLSRMYSLPSSCGCWGSAPANPSNTIGANQIRWWMVGWMDLLLLTWKSKKLAAHISSKNLINSYLWFYWLSSFKTANLI